MQAYHQGLEPPHKEIAEVLAKAIAQSLPDAESKLWHRHPVWFLDGNPVVGYSVQKRGTRLMFWSGADFEESALEPGTGKFKDASVFYNHPNEINHEDLQRWLIKAREIQWDYQHIVKRKGKLIKL